MHFMTLYHEIRRNRQRDGEYDFFGVHEKTFGRRLTPYRVRKFTAENEQWGANKLKGTFPQA